MPDGTYIPAGQVKEVTYGGTRYRCGGCGSCTPIGKGSSSNAKPPRSQNLTTSQQASLGIMGAFLGVFFGSSFSGGLFDDSADDDIQRQKAQDEQKRIADERKKQEELKKQLLAQYNQRIAQANVQTQNQNQSTSKQSTASQSPFSFQTLGGQLSAFQWQSPGNVQSSILSDSNNSDELLRASSDLNKILGNVVQDKVTEKIEEVIENQGQSFVEKLDEKYQKKYGAKIYEHGLPIIKIAVTAKKEGIPQAGAETIDYAVSLIPMPTMQNEVADVGRKIYSKVAFWAIDKFLSETEKAGSALGFDFNKAEFWQQFESDMTTKQKIVYQWLKGD